MCRHVARREVRAAWLVAMAGSLMLAGSALAQPKRGGGGDDKSGPAVAPARPAPQPAAPPRAAPPQAPPVVRQAPQPVRPPAPQAAPVVRQVAPPPAAPKPVILQQPPVVRQAPAPQPTKAAAPQSPPVIRQAAPPQAPPKAAPVAPPVIRQPVQPPPVVKSIPTPVPTKSVPIVRQSSGPKSDDGIRQPWTGGTKSDNPVAGGIKPDRGGIRPDAGGIKPSSDNPVTGGIKPDRGGIRPDIGGIKPSRNQNPVLNAAPTTKTPWTRSGMDKTPVIRSHSGGEFSKPLPSVRSDSPIRHASGFDRRPNPAPAADNLRLAVNVGVGAGIGFGASNWFGNTYVNFTFGNWHGYSPYAYPGYGWCRPRHYGGWGFDPYRHCNPWGGYYYVRRWPCYPFTYWYPGYTVSVNACGPWYRISYHRPVSTWLVNFRYCDAPCETFTDCSLIAPAVVCSTPPAVFRWSEANTYRYSYVNPVAAEVPYSPETPVAEILPAPASADELAHTTGRELGDTYMRLGDEASAIRVYSSHVANHPGDVRALRSLGVALIERGDVDQGTGLVERSYLIDPTLANTAFDRELLRDVNHLSEVLDRVTARAGQLDGKPEAAAPWLTVAVLMQADGRTSPARVALDKAKDAGLAPKVVEFMQAELPLENKP